MKNLFRLGLISAFICFLNEIPLKAGETSKASSDTVEMSTLVKDARKNVEKKEHAERIKELFESLDKKEDTLRGAVGSEGGVIGDFLSAASDRSDDREALQKFEKSFDILKSIAGEVYRDANALKSEIEDYNTKYKSKSDITWDKVKKEIGLDAEGVPIVDVSVKGTDKDGKEVDVKKRLRFDVGELSGKATIASASKKLGTDTKLGDDSGDASSRGARLGATSSSRRKRIEEILGRSATSETTGCSDPDANKPKGPGTLEKVVAYAMPALAMGLTGWATSENMKFAKQRIKVAERLMQGASARGESPLAYMPTMAYAYNYNPMEQLPQGIASAMYAVSSIYNASYGQNGYLSNQEFLRHMIEKDRSINLRMLLDRKRYQQQESSSASTSQVVYERRVNDLRNILNDVIPDFRSDIDRFKRAIGEFGGNAQYNAKIAAELQSAAARAQMKSQWASKMGQLLDQVEKGVDQAEEGTRNGQANGLDVDRMTLTRTGASQFQSQGQGVGPFGGRSPGQQLVNPNGGGLQFRAGFGPGR